MRRQPEYQVEPTELWNPIWERGHIEPWELLRICAWKSAKSLASLSLNDQDDIRTRTHQACEHVMPFKDADVLRDGADWPLWETTVRSAIGSKLDGTGLLGLSGIGYPVATAILCILNPAAFPVLDIWAIRAIYGSEIKTTYKFVAATPYREYAERLCNAGKGRGRTIHDLDKQAMRAGMQGDRL